MERGKRESWVKENKYIVKQDHEMKQTLDYMQTILHYKPF